MNIFISNISQSATDFQLKKLFSAFGEVTSAKIATNDLAKESKACGSVQMMDVKAAINAIQTLNGSLFLGSEIQVSEAQFSETNSFEKF